MIDDLSYTSILIETYYKNNNKSTKLGSATGFIIEEKELLYLVTNWHVASGRNVVTDKPLDKKKAGIPNILKIKLLNNPPKLEREYHDIVLHESVHDDYESVSKSKKWIEHPKGSKIDVVLLPLDPSKFSTKIPDKLKFDLKLKDTDVILEPAMRVSIIGFPLGKSGGKQFPIWVTGFIASEPEMDAEELPMLYVNAPGRSGLSGAPVIFKSYGEYRSSNGINYGNPITKFIGINSGRLEPDGNISSDICRIWKPVVLEQILNQI